MRLFKHRKCGAAVAQCVCKLDRRHKGPHVCDCEGSWSFNPRTGKFKVYAWPTTRIPR